jgi:hypothetical protein
MFSDSLKRTLDTEFSKALGQVSAESGGDILQSHQAIKKELPEMNRKKFKKSEVEKLIGKKEMKLPIGKITSVGKTNEDDSKFTKTTKKEMMEEWSQKYKDSIDCKNPKGFSQKAHCQGKNKKETKEATASGAVGGFTPPIAFKPSKFVRDSFEETPKKGEFKEAMGASSAGSYLTPKAWAKSTSKKDWRGKSKTQIPGGQFVQVKKKCKKFPYCNQGDIKALNLYNESVFNEIVLEFSKKYNLSENTIKNMIIKEFINNTK